MTTFIDKVTTITAAWLNSVDTLVQDIADVKSFGAKGDGVTDDTTAVQAAITANYGKMLFFPKAKYKCSSLSVSQSLGIFFEQGAEFDFSSSALGTVFLTISGSESGTVNLSADAAAKATSVQTNSLPTGCVAGSYVRIASDAIFDSQRTSSKTGEITRVLSVSGAGPYTINLAGALTFAYATANTARISVITPIKNFTMVGNGRIIGGGAGKQHVAVCGIKTHTSLFEGLQIEACETQGIWLQDDMQSLVTRCTVRDANYSSTGYGVVLDNACVGTRVIGNHFYNCRHATTLGNSTGLPGISNGTVFRDNHCFYSTGDAFDTHAAHWNVTFENNVVHRSAGMGINVECPRANIKGNIIRQADVHGIVCANWSDYAADYLINGNIIEASTQEGVRVQDGSASTASVQSLSVQQNRINATGIGVYVWTVGTGIDSSLVVSNNQSVTSAASTAAIYLESSQNFTICGNNLVPASAAFGIRVRDSKYGVVSNNIISLPTSSTGGGVYLNASGAGLIDRITVNGNRLSGSSLGSAKGVFIDSTCTNCTVTEDNDFALAGTPYSISGTGHVIQFPIYSVSHTIPSLGAGAVDLQLISVSGVSAADVITASISADLQGMVLSAFATGTNAVRVQVQNITGGTINLGTVTLYLSRRRLA